MTIFLHSKCMSMIKSQSAMEYLMTYGWSILVVAVVLGALAYLGLFNPLYFAPKANPGSCQVFRPNGAGTSYDINLLGVCNNEIPQFVGKFNGYDSAMLAQNAIPNAMSAITITLWIDPFNSLSSWTLPFTDEWTQQIAWDGSSIAGTTNGGNWGYSPKLLTNSWYFVALSANNIGGTLYVNGDAVNTLSGSIASESTTVYIGGTGEAGGGGCCAYAFDGYISNVQVYNASLDQSSIIALYQEGIGGAPINLQSLQDWWPLNGDVNDYSGNYHDGTTYSYPSSLNQNDLYTDSWINSYNPP